MCATWPKITINKITWLPQSRLYMYTHVHTCTISNTLTWNPYVIVGNKIFHSVFPRNWQMIKYYWCQTFGTLQFTFTPWLYLAVLCFMLFNFIEGVLYKHFSMNFKYNFDKISKIMTYFMNSPLNVFHFRKLSSILKFNVWQIFIFTLLLSFCIFANFDSFSTFLRC